jgi:hypothetical protein
MTAGQPAQVRGVHLQVDARVAVPEKTFLGRQPLHEHIQAAQAHAQIVVANKCVHAWQDGRARPAQGLPIQGQSVSFRRLRQVPGDESPSSPCRALSEPVPSTGVSR